MEILTEYISKYNQNSTGLYGSIHYQRGKNRYEVEFTTFSPPRLWKNNNLVKEADYPPKILKAMINYGENVLGWVKVED